MLFGSYRRGDANDPDTYVAAIAAVLSSYSPEVIRESTDPRTGIAATERFAAFMPNAGELKIHCDGVAAFRDRLARARELPPVVPSHMRLAAPEPAVGRHATTFVPSSHSRYPEFVAWSQAADVRYWRAGPSDGRQGIWVCYGEFCKATGRPVREPTDQRREAAE